ncbi:MAG: PRC-barrel domain-containing protein [Steroidobacteraceae bacterium]
MNAGIQNRNGIIGFPDSPNGPGPHIMAADSLTGEKVVNQTGEGLGEITHIMLDLTQGTIAYAVLSFGGLLGIHDKLFAVPWHCLALDVENKWFVLNVDKDQLRNAPGFDKNHWPAMADPDWARDVHAYYGPRAVSRRPFI